VLSKDEVREQVWTALERARVAGFPGARGRIPNFTGAAAAAERLRGSSAWQNASTLKCNPDYAQRPVRLRALRDGKTVYVAVPRLRSEQPFIELDPERIGEHLAEATTIPGAERLGRRVGVDGMPAIDVIVAGSVAAGRDGVRVGKGGGYSDLEYGLLREARRVSETTPIATTVHLLQVFDAGALPRSSHDITLDLIAMPEELIVCEGRPARPHGIDRSLLSSDQLADMPAVAELLARREGT
jgi:5-formyltetrahydrofolate cyclo-ligase